jgi:hypothetical protein
MFSTSKIPKEVKEIIDDVTNILEGTQKGPLDVKKHDLLETIKQALYSMLAAADCLDFDTKEDRRKYIVKDFSLWVQRYLLNKF